MDSNLFLEYEIEYLPLPFQKLLKQLMTEKVGKYFPTISFITYKQKKVFEEYCKSDTTHRYYRLNVTYKFIKDQNKLPYILYLTKLKSEENLQEIRKRKKTHTIIFSGSHFDKVCKKTVENNYKFEALLNDIYSFDSNIMREPKEDYSIIVPKYKWKNKSKKDEKIVSIGGKQDLKKTIMEDNVSILSPLKLNFPTPSPLIRKKTSKKKTSPPPLIPKKTSKEYNPFKFPKKFIPKRNENSKSQSPVFTIPKKTRPSLLPINIPKHSNVPNNSVNILKNILSSEKTQKTLGLSLTTDLDAQIKNLDYEVAFGLVNIISSLVTANVVKKSTYLISKRQIKEIIEGFITILNVLLNPTQ